MAYVVSRPSGRFEIRESVLTASGPRSRTLANFSVLTTSVMESASRRASRKFNSESVLKSAAKAGVSLVDSTGFDEGQWDYDRFVNSSKKMARVLDNSRLPASPSPGKSLIDLLDLAEEISRSLPKRPFEPLAFPPLAKLTLLKH